MLSAHRTSSRSSHSGLKHNVLPQLKVMKQFAQGRPAVTGGPSDSRVQQAQATLHPLTHDSLPLSRLCHAYPGEAAAF